MRRTLSTATALLLAASGGAAQETEHQRHLQTQSTAPPVRHEIPRAPQSSTAPTQAQLGFSLSCMTAGPLDTTLSQWTSTRAIMITNRGPADMPAGTRIHWMRSPSEQGDHVFAQPLQGGHRRRVENVLNVAVPAGLPCTVTVPS